MTASVARAAAETPAILVPLDGSEVAENVLPLAGALAKATHAELRLARVHAPPTMAMANAYEWNEEIEKRELGYLATVSGRVERTMGLAPRIELLTGHAPDAIRHAAQQNDETLIVMSSHGRTGFSRLWLGSVADSVARGCGAPVLIVRSDAESQEVQAGHLGRVLVPLDGSTVSESILPHALRLCGAMGASLVLFRAMPPDEIPHVDPALQQDATEAAIRDAETKLRAVAARLCGRARQTPIEVVVRVHESPAAAINEYAAANGISAVALTSRGVGLARLMGSVADKVIRGGPPVILLFWPPDSELPELSRQALH